MQAICVTPERTLTVRDLPAPSDPPPGHVVVRMAACAINPGDKFFLNAPALRAAPRSSRDVWGASGAGTVLAGPPAWIGRSVAVYRSLAPSEHTIGTWCEIAQLPIRACALIPEGLPALDYCGSLVNVITAYAFAKQALADGHRGVLITAGSSATGRALVGVARSLGLPTVALVRTATELPADEVVVGDDAAAAIERHAATAVFDGVGGALLSRLVPQLAQGSTIYSYGYLGGHDMPLQLPTTLLMTKALTIRSFSNFASPTVHDHLDAALLHVGELLALPTSKTPLGPTFAFAQIDQAMALVGKGEGKPVLVP